MTANSQPMIQEEIGGQVREETVRQVSIRQRAWSGMVWTYSAQPVRIGTQLLRSVILTRLLFPEAFGLMALGSVVGTAAQMFADVGIQPSLVQSKRGEDEKFLQTAWTIQIIRGFILCAVTMIMAWPAALYFDKPLVFWVVFVGALGFVISGFNTTVGALHHRRMTYRRISILKMIVPLINLAVVAALAYWLRSVWALIIGGLIGQAIGVFVFFFMLSGVKHRLRLDRDSLKELFGFGKWVFVSTVLTFFAIQCDKVLLGRLLTTEMMGLYSIALIVAAIPERLISPLASGVLFPAVAEKARAKDPRLAEKVIRARGAMLKMSLVLIAGLVVVSPALFELMYDPRYWEAGRIAQWVMLAIWFSMMSQSTGKCLLALGKSRSLAMSNAVNLAVTLIGAGLGFYGFGLEGFIAGYALGNAAGALVQDHQLHRLGVPVFRQDLLWSAAAGVLVALALLARYWGHQVWSLRFGGELLGVGVVLLATGALVPSLMRELPRRSR